MPPSAVDLMQRFSWRWRATMRTSPWIPSRIWPSSSKTFWGRNLHNTPSFLFMSPLPVLDSRAATNLIDHDKVLLLKLLTQPLQHPLQICAIDGSLIGRRAVTQSMKPLCLQVFHFLPCHSHQWQSHLLRIFLDATAWATDILTQ